MAKKTHIKYLRPSVMWNETTKGGDFSRKKQKNSLNPTDRGREASMLDKNRERVQAKSQKQNEE